MGAENRSNRKGFVQTEVVDDGEVPEDFNNHFSCIEPSEQRKRLMMQSWTLWGFPNRRRLVQKSCQPGAWLYKGLHEY
eukprot:615597-Amphidinium_carterae.1